MTPAESKSDRTDPPLTAADLDRLAALLASRPDESEIGEYSVNCSVCNQTFSLEDYGPADADLMTVCSACVYKIADEVPSLLALARRGLEAEQYEREAQDKAARYLARDLEGQAAREVELESKLAAAIAEVERVKARLEKALLAIRLGFHAERFVVGDEGVTRYSCCGKEYVCADPFVNDHEKDCKAVQLANAAEAQAGQAAKQGGENVRGNEHGAD